MRGDRPRRVTGACAPGKFTPHARGSTPFGIPTCRACLVYPACAGIDLLTANTFQSVISLPRMRGDRPIQPDGALLRMSFTPHARGSTCHKMSQNAVNPVYPACAGIDRQAREKQDRSLSLPRMRGDRP